MIKINYLPGHLIMNPYEDLPPHRYWKTGVKNEINTKLISNLWHSKFKIKEDTKFITVGSCFAQHISKWIKKNSFNWIDSEPGPQDLSPNELLNNGYGVFSFRTGNIYTPALLKQWIFQALDLDPRLNEVGIDGGCFFDPFRPNIPNSGYLSADDVISSRNFTLECIAKSLKNADIFIFTLGLTEAWEHVSGYVYPSCPGTIKGMFNPSEHIFINYDYTRVLNDLIATFEAIKRINPKIKFLLTVSPVPLTATASQEHVLSAAIYSKSVLRSVAGFLKMNRNDVDYFPSYELIASFTSQGKYFEDNLRNVKKDGVDFVMSHFANGISDIPPTSLTQNNYQLSTEVESQEKISEICEDILLENWNQANKEIAFSGKHILIGDSHMFGLSNSLTQQGLEVAGGATMRGHIWANNGFHFDRDELIVPLDDSLARKNWLNVLKKIQTCSGKPKYIVTNVGMQSNFVVPELYRWALSEKRSLINQSDIEKYFIKHHQPKLRLAELFRNMGFECILVSDPPVQDLNESFKPLIPLLILYENTIFKIYEQLGCHSLNIRSTLLGGATPFEWYIREGEPDWVHGSPRCYDEIAKYLINKWK